jgi:hypothetical protein
MKDVRAMFMAPTKQAPPAMAAATASQRKGLRHAVKDGRSNLHFDSNRQKRRWSVRG